MGCVLRYRTHEDEQKLKRETTAIMNQVNGEVSKMWYLIRRCDASLYRQCNSECNPLIYKLFYYIATILKAMESIVKFCFNLHYYCYCYYYSCRRMRENRSVSLKRKYFCFFSILLGCMSNDLLKWCGGDGPAYIYRHIRRGCIHELGKAHLNMMHEYDLFIIIIQVLSSSRNGFGL